MTKYTITFLLTLTLPFSIWGQSLTLFFNQLPVDCTPELSYEQRNDLLKNLEFIIPGGTTMETVKYTIDTSLAATYIRYEYSYTTGQRGFIKFELRKFTKTSGESFLVFSRCGGATSSYAQQEIRVFKIKDNKLIEDANQKILPKRISLDSFLKKETPEATKKQLSGLLSCCFDLLPEHDTDFEFNLFEQAPLEDNIKWLVGYSILFRWNGKTFTQQWNDRK